ncbi:N-formylglutamate amidohydrolase [Paracoccus sp. MC1854]|nr:N-formylglutamate amidohydrolase [Paracoccus sp. MC1854]MBB1492252.1 N-formylglutamate amidohydrolase [Paracoccus sp. MC1854]
MPAPDGPTFDIARPADWVGGVIFASPHSGRDYPGWFLAESMLDPHVLRSSEDAFVDRLIAPAVAAGAVTLTARVPRCVVDLNRGADELDPAAIEGAASRRADPRIQSGLGVIPRVVAQGRAIRRGKLTLAEAQRRIDALWRPYHAALEGLMAEAVARHGRAILIDVHSMPREALLHLQAPPPDIVLGDRNGASADPAISEAVHGALIGAGFRVRRNSPFAGAHVASAYGRPLRGCHVVQMEIDRSLYMDEAAIRPHRGFDDLARRLGGVIAHVAALPLDGTGLPLAAE